jgi:hypothetical protein
LRFLARAKLAETLALKRNDWRAFLRRFVYLAAIVTRLSAETRQNRPTDAALGRFDLWLCRDWAIEGQSLVKTCRPGHWVVAGFFFWQKKRGRFERLNQLRLMKTQTNPQAI